MIAKEYVNRNKLISCLILIMILSITFCPAAAELKELKEPEKGDPYDHDFYDWRLKSVFCSSESDVWIVGGRGQILHYDGNKWHYYSKVTDFMLEDVRKFQSGEVKVVGYDHHKDVSIVLTFYKNKWQKKILKKSKYAEILWGKSDEDYAVVGDGFLNQYDKSAESVITFKHTLRFKDIWGMSKKSLYLVGFSKYIYHYNGKKLKPLIEVNSDVLYGIDGVSEENMIAVGNGSSSNGAIYHIRRDSVSKVINVEDLLFDVWCADENNAVAVGANGAIYRYDGKNWKKMKSPTKKFLFGVCGTSMNDIYAVGEHLTVLHYDGKEWKRIDTGTRVKWIPLH